MTLLFLTSFSAQSGEHLLSRTEIRSIVGTFPPHGSQEEMNDDNVLLELQQTRTQQDCEAAASQSKLHVVGLFALPSGPLTKQELKRLKVPLLKLQATLGANIVWAKRLYKRQRPYLRNPEIVPCIRLENSSSFPSGHSATGRAVGKYLSKIYPDRAIEIMRIANQVGKNRMIGGVHHPSDVIAGQKLGDAIANNFIHDRDCTNNDSCNNFPLTSFGLGYQSLVREPPNL